MIFRLRNVGHENLEAIVERNVIVLIFFDSIVQLGNNFVGALHIGRGLRARRGHIHM